MDTEIHFEYINKQNFTEAADRFTAKVKVILSSSGEFVPYSENAANAVMPYGMVDDRNTVLKYGYPCMEAAKDTRPYAWHSN